MDWSRATWRKSTRSGSTGNCVEVADNLPAVVAVRDSKDQQGPVLSFGAGQWAGFVQSIKGGKFNV
ncbi:DUF397 domain-containing protein [Micromonospora sp. NPDC049101]|uniref:DUF397 domain-containing protein n=1 Tax=Micromonospora sp. NPDC049101 TaxID=3155032 RepID=UPI0034012828